MVGVSRGREKGLSSKYILIYVGWQSRKLIISWPDLGRGQSRVPRYGVFLHHPQGQCRDDIGGDVRIPGKCCHFDLSGGAVVHCGDLLVITAI